MYIKMRNGAKQNAIENIYRYVQKLRWVINKK